MFKRIGFHRWFASTLLVLLISACAASHRNDSSEYGRASMIGGIWKLSRFDAVAGETGFEITEPDRYTLSLLADGSYRVRADCNRMQGGYRLEGQRLTLITDMGRLVFGKGEEVP